jgi:hypothetical protein
MSIPCVFVRRGYPPLEFLPGDNGALAPRFGRDYRPSALRVDQRGPLDLGSLGMQHHLTPQVGKNRPSPRIAQVIVIHASSTPLIPVNGLPPGFR